MPMPGARNIGLPLMNLVRLKRMPILQQLHLEERMLRTSSDNWCIINDGTDDPTIVMGISGIVNIQQSDPNTSLDLKDLDGEFNNCGASHTYLYRKPVELVEIDSVLRDEIPVIRRFTGGGTVIVDPGTIFVTFICNKDAVPGLQSYPRPIMSWSSLVYRKVFQGIGDFGLRENDYVLGNYKFGGNAQSITKNRWIHHTSFLWDYEISNMGYLRHPKRAPEYRQARGHLEFICRMKDYIPRPIFIDRTIDALSSHFLVKPIELEGIKDPTDKKFRPSSRLLSKQELEVAAVDSHSGIAVPQ